MPVLTRRIPILAALSVFAVLLATADERSFGLVPDGREMLSAATSLASFGEVGISQDFVNAVPSPHGDAFSRYGTGQSLAEVPFLLAARLLHAISPSASSAPLLVLLPMLSLAAAAWGVARALAAAGASPGWQLLAGAGSVLATPLLGYAASDYAEPLAAALVAVGAAMAFAIRLERPTRARLTAAGVALGLLLLVKSLLLVIAVPLLFAAAFPTPAETEAPRRKTRPAKAPGTRWHWRVAAAAAVPVLLWFVLEIVRFGRLFGGYPGETFTYPIVTGLLRLTVFPNKGLFVYAPVLVLSVLGIRTLMRRDRVLAVSGVFGASALLVASAAWWAWDGQAGWGPRLVLPALPLLAACLGPLLAAPGAARRAAPLLLAAGFLVNLPGLLQPFGPVYALATAVPPQPIAEARAAGTPYEIFREADGTLRATGPHHLSLTPAWAPPLVHARLLLERLRGGDIASRLAAAGLGLAPPFRPVPPTDPEAAYVQGVSAFFWPFWGRSWIAPLAGAADPLSIGLSDQLVRAVDLGRLDRALALGRELEAGEGAAPRTGVLALAAEAAQLSGKTDEAARLLSRAEPCHPWVLFVRRRRGEPVDTCLPAEFRAGFLAGADAAQAAGARLTTWARRALRRDQEEDSR